MKASYPLGLRGLSCLLALCAPLLCAADSPARLDLTSDADLAAVHGSWRYSDARLVAVKQAGADVDGQPGGPLADTYDIAPRAGGAGFDDSQWPIIAPRTLRQRRGAGRISFGWYRLSLTLPERLAGMPTRGHDVIFSVTVDDYAEVWVNGELARAAGQRGGSVVAGWNAENRVTVARSAEPGQQITVAVFGMNGPLSDAPRNFIFVRDAHLELAQASQTPTALVPTEVNVEVERLAAELDDIVPSNPKLYKLAEGFRFTEGPVWQGDHLLFSDPNANRIYRWSERDGLSVFREHSGYEGADIAEYSQPGSNGLALDPAGRLTINEHGYRRVTRLEPDGALTVLAARYGDKRLNSPNDLVYRSDGMLYFTDPPFGLPRFADDPRRELDVSGVFRVMNGKTELLSSELRGPNGIAFSPDERWLYVGNWDPARKVVMRYAVATDGSLGAGEVLADLGTEPGEDAIDGIKVDTMGHLYVSGPGGLWVLSPDGRRLGHIRAPRQVHNMAWGGPQGKDLYLTAHDALYRLPLRIAGHR